MMLKSHSKKSHSKEMPFNVSLPWGESVASYLGITIDELKTNYKKDKALTDEIASACTMVRDYSIKELTKTNVYANKTLKELC